MAKPPIPPPPVKPSTRKVPLPPEKGGLFPGTLPFEPETALPPKPPQNLPSPKAPDPQVARILGMPVEGKGPPLFIKIDKYKDVVNSLHALKSYALSLRDALDALADIEKELQHGLSITHKALDKFNTTITTLDVKITRSSPDEVEAPPLDTTEMDDYVKQLHDQMEKIKQDLQKVSF